MSARGRTARSLALCLAVGACAPGPQDGGTPAPAGNGPPAAAAGDGVPLLEAPVRPLELRILAPQAGARIGGKALEVQVATTADVRSVTVNDAPASPTGPGQRLFRHPLRGLKDGPLEITVTATGTDDAAAVATVAVVVDQTPPVITLEGPTDGLTTDQEQVDVRGHVQDDGPVVVAVNQQRVSVDEAGRFRTTVTLLADRPTEVEVLARDAAGNLDKIRRMVQRDAKAPDLTILVPADGATVGGTVVEVQGTVDDPTVTVTVNQQRALVADGRFRVGLVLAEGTHEIAAVATDAAGNHTSQTRRFQVDRTPPALTLEAPAADLITQAMSVEVRGRVDDPAVAQVRIGTAVAAVTAGRFRADVPLAEGTNDLTVVAVDAAGNRDEVPLSVVRDSRGPGLRIVQPLDGDVVTAPTIELRGRSGEPLDAITLNGEALTVAADGTFRGALVLHEGRNELVLTAVDLAGNQSQRRLVVTRRRAAELAAPGFLLVPSGAFTMGRNDGTADEGPEHDAYLAAYHLAPTEVTNAEYAKFVQWIAAEQAARRDPHRFCHPDEPPNKVHVAQFSRDAKLAKADLPVVGVDWFDAYAYARWSGGRLPSEAEWERAAGWDAERNRRRRFPWGDAFRAGAASLDPLRGARPVGSVASDKSPAGALDMGGNVQEWTADWYRGGYDGPPATPGHHRPPRRYTPRFRVVRGASWKHCDPVSAAVTYRMIEDPLTRRDDLGFRVCRTP